MKKYLFIGLIFLSCKKEEVAKKPVLDCDCDRVVDVSVFNYNGYESGSYVTINDCSKVQKNRQWQETQNKPKLGECD